MNFTEKLIALRKLIKKEKLNGFIAQRSDEYQNKSIAAYAERIAWLTGFTGSFGITVITNNSACLLVDGRYAIQAKQEVNETLYKILINNSELMKWLSENLNKKTKLGFDPWLFTETQLKIFNEFELIALKENLIDIIWAEKPLKPNMLIEIYSELYAGESSLNKKQRIASEIKTDALLLTSPASICWLLNIRGNDVPPLPFVYALLYKNSSVNLYRNVSFDKEKIFNDLEKLNSVTLDPDLTPVAIAKSINPEKILKQQDPCILAKAIKNKTELKGMRTAQFQSGIALIEFLAWLENKEITELEAAEKLHEFYAESKSFRCLSFPTILAAGKNSAIVHYNPHFNNDLLEHNSICLIDSGAHYLEGTTDTTRTIIIGEADLNKQNIYTKVLKGHISLASAIFPIRTTGCQLDALARQWLWQDALDYDHGTGHGVGCFLEVHEGPQCINKTSTIPLEAGMIVSIEPGCYIEGKYGIRLENLYEIINCDNGFLKFSNMTLVPFDNKLINKGMLSKQEINWINSYHKTVYDSLKNLVSKKALSWLEKSTLDFI